MEPFIGQIMAVGFNFAPRGWAKCDGQLLPISQNSALFSLLGTMYGGDGRTTFGLPDLRGRVAIHNGSGPGLSSYTQGSRGGVENVTLNQNQIPFHTHTATAQIPYTTDEGNESVPSANNIFADGVVTEGRNNVGDANIYKDVLETGHKDINATVGNTGGGQSHTNVQPYLCVNYVIALVGIFPSRS